MLSSYVTRNHRLAICVFICFMLGIAGVMPGVMARQAAIDLNAPDAMRLTIESQMGKRVKLKLVSGQDVEGQVAKVGSQAVLLTELTGQDFFDATVKLDQVTAVIVKARGGR